MSFLSAISRQLELLLYALAALGLLVFWLISFGMIYLSALLCGAKATIGEYAVPRLGPRTVGTSYKPLLAARGNEFTKTI